MSVCGGVFAATMTITTTIAITITVLGMELVDAQDEPAGHHESKLKDSVPSQARSARLE